MLQKNKLDFSDFLTTSTDEWKKNILKELKTESEEALLQVSEGIAIKAFYTSNDLKDLTYLKDFHNLFEIKSPRHWYNAEYIKVESLQTANKMAQTALNAGADALYFNCSDKDFQDEEPSALLKNIPLSFARIYLSVDSPLHHSARLITCQNDEQVKGTIIKAQSLRNSLINKGLLEEYFGSFIELREYPNFKSLGIDGSLKQPNPIKEISFAISLAIELIDYITGKNIPAMEVLSQVEFSFSTGKNYFVEIAKLRAFRLLWKKIAEVTDPVFNSLATKIHCNTSDQLFTNDPYYNILHNTTEAMSAIIGGGDSITIMPSDIHINTSNEFSSRIARNISLILKEEAHLNYAVDPAGGAYMIEKITNDIAQKSLQLIKEIERKGGLIQYLNVSEA